MKKNDVFKAIDLSILFLTIFIFLLSMIFNIYNKTFLGFYLLFTNIYLCIKCRKQKKLFFIFIILFYFNFSFVITRYIGEPSSLMQHAYNQIKNESSMKIGIILQIVFLSIINIIIGDKEKNLKDEDTDNINVSNIENRTILIHTLQVILVLVLGYHLVLNISTATTLLEYSIFLFIFALYFSKNDKKNRIITEIIILLFAIYSLKNGDRIAILQIILVDFIINYIHRIKIKHILILMIVGIFAFTIFGLYGDFLIYGQDFKNLTLEYTINEIKERRFALDTSASAYFTGISMIDVRDNYNIETRVKDGIEYFTKYTLLGSKSNYIPIENKIKEYQVNYGGGFSTCRFYYWFSWLGIIFISCYIGILIKKVIMNPNSLYKSLLSIFIISTIPRWYLYDPSLLFRGIILFSIVYFIISKLFIQRKTRLISEETNIETEIIKEKPLITVIVPIYNAENTIERCVNSITMQTYSNLEIILINDGSNDQSLKVCQDLQKKDNRIIVIDKENEGVSETRNKGIEIAQGEYIIFVDSDDFLENNMIEVLYYSIQNYDLCTCNYYMVKNNKKKEKSNIESYTIECGEINEYIEKMQKGMLFYNLWNKIYKTELIKKHNIRFEKDIHIGEDYLFNIEYLKYITKAKYISKPLYNYVIKDGTLSQKYTKRPILIEMKMVRNVKEIYEKRLFNMVYIYNQYIELLKSNIYNLQIGQKSKEEIEKFIKEYIKELEKDGILGKEIRNKLSKENKIIFMILERRNIKILYQYFKTRYIIKMIIKRISSWQINLFLRSKQWN